MPFPDSVDDPRDDVRPPTYAKGQWFGPVPRSRVFVQVSAADEPFGFLVAGVVFQNVQFPTDSPPSGDAEWEGFVIVDAEVVQVRYTSTVNPSTSGFGSATFSVRTSTPPGGEAIYRLVEKPFEPGTQKSLALAGNFSGVTMGQFCEVVFVPEWARPSDRWPFATIADVAG